LAFTQHVLACFAGQALDPEQTAIAATRDLAAAVCARDDLVERLDEVVRNVGGPLASLPLLDAVGQTSPSAQRALRLA
jgi:hypothetical protein